MNTLAVIFLVLLVMETGVRLWLANRQIGAARMGGGAVPEGVADLIAVPDHSRAAQYMTARLRLSRIVFVFDAALKALLTFGGGLALIAGVLLRFNLAEPWRGTLLILVTFGFMRLVSLPISLYRTFGIEARFGFNRTTPALYALDLLKEALLGVLIDGPIAAVVLVLMQRAGAYWWLWAWVSAMLFTLVMTWAYPRFLAPLFNRFSPLSDAALKARLEVLLQRCDFAAQGGLFVMDASRRSSHGNAYFTGIGRNKRIVLFDTLLAGLDAGEVEAVLAHELGHFKLHHIRQRLLLSTVQTFVLFVILGWFSSEPGIFGAFGASVPSAAMSLLLFVIVLPTFTFLLTPLASLWSRRHEFEADRFAAEHADAGKLSRALVKLCRDNASLMAPDPVYSAFYDSHPPLLARIARLRQSAATRGS